MNDETQPSRGILHPRTLTVGVLILLFVGLLVFVGQSIFISADVVTVPEYNREELKQRYQSGASASPTVTPSVSPTPGASETPIASPTP